MKSYSRLLPIFLLFLSTYARILDSGKDDPPSPQDEYDSRYWITVMPYSGTGCDPSTPLPNSAIIHRSFNTYDNYVTDGECHPIQAGDLVGSVQIIGGEKCRVSLHSGSNCEGWRWTPENTACNNYIYASARIWCWDGRAYGPAGIGKRTENKTEMIEAEWNG